MNRQWLYVVVGLGLVGALVIAARAGRGGSDAEQYAQRHPEVAAAQRLVMARTDSVRAWTQAVTRARSLAHATSVSRGAEPFVVETRGDISRGTRDAYAAAFARELAAVPDPRVPLRVLLVADSAAGYSWYAGWYLRPSAEGEPCAIVIYLRESRGQTYLPRPGDRRLGVCGLYARHGLPGPGIAAWLDRTASAGALADTIWQPDSAVRRAAMRGSGRRGDERLPVGRVLGHWLPAAACAAGRDAACEPAMFDPAANIPRRVSLDIAQHPRLASAYPFDLQSYPGDVTAALRESLGPADFERWWQSALPPAEAYEAVRGEPFAEWARGYLARAIGTRKPGPLRAGLPIGLGVGMLVVLALAGVRWGRRERS